ncbi:hypothetical protein HPB50_000151 [Hyalomma asiaticum]|uniref:Uncharacterized protein n=1 Tax=Hyalomma asiaticum TaxID=266040 RepID=A0ACB7RI68_HYAAI|nr:hypothetical protein HPB50_000151 [Hyalomma asiaticum]
MRPAVAFSFALLLILHGYLQLAAGNKCELKGCPKPKFGHINVHVLCHSHNDAGWLHTVDFTYNDSVRLIYDSVLEALEGNHKRRYVSAENVFFSRWWHDQPKAARHRVHQLVQSGRLQFVGGGWVQNDEAVTHYTAIIDQMTLGLRFLNDTFGPDCGVPSVAWQADPFGHTVTQASLFAKMGFSSMMVGRVSMDTLEQWKASNHMGFIWKMTASANGHANSSEDDALFTWVPWNSYSTPPQLCFDACSYEEPAQTYGGKTVPLMMGDDLTWSKAVEHYQDADDLLSRANRMGRWPMNILRWFFKGEELRPVNVMYSTPACFVEALHSEKSRSWPRFEDDLLPYTDRPKHTWTGFYTTRPSLKMMTRYANGFLQEVISSALSKLSMSPGPPRDRRGEKRPQFGFCHLLNESHCPYSEGDSELVLLPRHPETSGVEPFTNATSALLFRALIRPLGFSVYRVVASAPGSTTSPPKGFLELDRPATFIENERYRVEIDPASGLVTSVLLRNTGASGQSSTPVSLRQTFAAYDQDQGDFSVPLPGHYVFSAHHEAQPLGDHVAYRVVKGPLVQEIHQIFNDYLSQAVTLHKGSDLIEFTWTVGPPSASDSSDVGQDVVLRYESDLDTEGFYTDSNGWRNVHRVVTVQEDKLPIPSNYYPVDTIHDLTMVVLPDRPQGGSSLKKGHIELMLHRWHTTNDELGNPESTWEPTMKQREFVASGTHRVFLGRPAEAHQLLRPHALQLVYRPLLVFAPAQWKPHREMFSGLRSLLPSTVHLLTLEALSRTKVLLRLEHLAIEQHAVQVNVTRLLKGFRLSNVRPVTLAANQFLPGPTRQKWPVRGQPRPKDSRENLTMPLITKNRRSGDMLVTLSPGQIVSLIATIAEREHSY